MNENDYRLKAYKKEISSAKEDTENKNKTPEIKPFVPVNFFKTENVTESNKTSVKGKTISSPGFTKLTSSDSAVNNQSVTSKNNTEKFAQSDKNLNSSAQIIKNNTQEKNQNAFVHKPVFQKINSLSEQYMQNKKDEEEILKEAQTAAKTGMWNSSAKSVPSSQDVKKAADVLKEGGLVKVTKQEAKPGEKESIYHRVAKFLLVIGIDEAAKILPHLTEEQTEKIIPEIASIRSVSSEEAVQVLEEFQTLVDKAREEGGLDTARTILSKAFGSKKAEAVIEKSVPYPNGKPFEYLNGVDADRIIYLLHNESAAVKALVLSQLEPKTSAAVITKMPADEKKDIIIRLAKMKTVMPQILQNIDKSLHQKMLSQNTENSSNLDGKNALAQILKKMDPSSEQKILNNLSEDNPELGADLRERLFTEEDIIGADDRFMQELLHDMSDEDIAYLIAAKNDRFRNKILSNVSTTRSDIILEEEQLRKPMLRSDCEKITSHFYAVLRRAWEEGKLFIAGRDADEIYV